MVLSGVSAPVSVKEINAACDRLPTQPAVGTPSKRLAGSTAASPAVPAGCTSATAPDAASAVTSSVLHHNPLAHKPVEAQPLPLPKPLLPPTSQFRPAVGTAATTASTANPPSTRLVAERRQCRATLPGWAAAAAQGAPPLLFLHAPGSQPPPVPDAASAAGNLKLMWKGLRICINFCFPFTLLVRKLSRCSSRRRSCELPVVLASDWMEHH